MKTSQSQKLEIARSRVDDGVPVFELAKKWEHDVGKLKRFCGLYELYGPSAFEDNGAKRVCRREEKLDAVRRFLSGESEYSIGLAMMLPAPETVRDWAALHRKGGEAALKGTHGRSHRLLREDGLDRVAGRKLMERLECLEAENQCLKNCMP
jgi:transposase-like protein